MCRKPEHKRMVTLDTYIEDTSQNSNDRLQLSHQVEHYISSEEFLPIPQVPASRIGLKSGNA